LQVLLCSPSDFFFFFFFFIHANATFQPHDMASGIPPLLKQAQVAVKALVKEAFKTGEPLTEDEPLVQDLCASIERVLTFKVLCEWPQLHPSHPCLT
jgi:hypothetical protein